MSRPWPRRAFALVLGCVAAAAYWQYWLAGRATNVFELVLVPVYLAAGFGLLANWLLPIATARLRSVDGRAPLVWAIVVLLGVLGLATWLRPPLAGSQAPMRITSPTQGPAAPRLHHLEVIATGNQDAESHSTEVWLKGLDFSDGTHAAVTDFQLGDGWQLSDGVPMSGGQTVGSLRWDGSTTGDAELHLLAHNWSGWAEVRWDGTSQTLNLYRPVTSEVVVPLPYDSPLAPPPATAAQVASLVAALASLGALVYIVGGLNARVVRARLPARPAGRTGSPGTPAA